MDTAAASTSGAATSHPAIRTTLYDLIAAISADVSPEDEQLVVAMVAYLLDTGQITFLGRTEEGD